MAVSTRLLAKRVEIMDQIVHRISKMVSVWKRFVTVQGVHPFGAKVVEEAPTMVCFVLSAVDDSDSSVDG